MQSSLSSPVLCTVGEAFGAQMHISQSVAVHCDSPMFFTFLVINGVQCPNVFTFMNLSRGTEPIVLQDNKSQLTV